MLMGMLDKINLKKNADWTDYDERRDKLEDKLGKLQRQCREKNIPVMIVFEGFEASGKGTMISSTIRGLDPRGFQVFTTEKETEEDSMRPYLWRFFTKTPPKGRIHIFDKSWYQGAMRGDIGIENINAFEKQLTDDGTVIIKFFLVITKAEQRRRMALLRANKSTKWRVTKSDIWENKNYQRVRKEYDAVLAGTDTDSAPWFIVEAMDRKFSTMKILSTIVKSLEKAVEINQNKDKTNTIPETEDDFRNAVLSGIDLSKSLTEKEYKKRKKKLQKKLSMLHNKIYKKRLPVVLAFEGWDAAGKGGAIKRITRCMDPRGYEVVPTASPNDIEKAHHYLWRFWEKFPKAGHMAIFDRTWYGRVMVERIEGFATESEWKRAYQEINDMENELVNAGAVVLKFWLHIDKDEQKKRFDARKNTPGKEWKITDEDWRNREKWDEYEKAVDEMIVRTSTEKAPWFIIEANDKLYARVKVLEIVTDAIEKALS